MKVGDKLYCKLSYKYGDRFIYTKDKFYEIVDIDAPATLYKILDDDDNKYDLLKLPHYMVRDMFYTIEELRLKKLESL